MKENLEDIILGTTKTAANEVASTLRLVKYTTFGVLIVVALIGIVITASVFTAIT